MEEGKWGEAIFGMGFSLIFGGIIAGLLSAFDVPPHFDWYIWPGIILVILLFLHWVNN